MAHSLSTASHTSAASELGISVGTNRAQTTLTRHANMNMWSFYRVGSIAPTGTYDLTTLTAPSNNDKLGDFRGYNQSALEPYPFDVYPSGKGWGPGGSTMSLTFQIYTYEWNLVEMLSGSTPYITVRYYISSKTRTAGNGTGGVRTYTTAITMTANSPPTDHTNDQLTKQASSSQLFTDANFPTSLLTTPDDVLYCDLYISDGSGNQVARFGTVQSDGYVNISTHENANPFVDGCAPNITPPSGYTNGFPVVTNSSSGKNGVDFAETQSDTGYGTFYWYLAGLSGSTWYRLGNVSAVANLVIKNPEGGSTQNTTQIFNSTLNSAGSSSNESASGTLSTSYSWNWDDVGDIEVTVPSWSGYNSYSLGSTAPTCT